MFDVVKFILRNSYYYGRFIGIINFSIDANTGRARITKAASIYGALINILTLGIFPWLYNNQVIHVFWTHAGSLHEYLFLAVLGGRVICLVASLLTRWRQRRIFFRLVNAFQRLAQEKPQVMKLWRRGVISKCVSITLSELLQMLLSLFVLRNKLTFKMFISVLGISTISAQVNVIVAQYYFAMLNVHGHYLLLNEELRVLLNETNSLEKERRKGIFITKCCALADRLDTIAATQYQLQALVKQTTSIFGLQILSMSTSYYMSTVALIYFIFSELRSSTITIMWSYWGVALTAIDFIWYFTDIHITVNVIYAVLDLHAEMMNLLSQRTVFANGLDERLQAALDSFQLQLAWNPLKIPVLNLYIMKKSKAVSMASSVVTSSLVLVQYDIQHS